MQMFSNWNAFKKSLYINTNLLALFLTLADVVFIMLLGLPTALYSAWINHFKGNLLMHFYFRKMAPILFKFIFFLRIIIITVLSLDRCLHLLRSVQFSKIATKHRMKYVIGLMFSVPVVMELIPTLVVFLLNDKAVICGEFEYDGGTESSLMLAHRANFTVPLTCETHLSRTPPGTTIPIFLLIVIMSSMILSCFVIVISNISIILMILKHAMKPIDKENPEWRKKMTKNLIRNSIMVVFIAALFFATSFPYVWVWSAEFIRTHVNTDGSEENFNSKVTFYITMLTFLPVIVHPWLYLFRLKTVQDLTPESSKTVKKSLSKAVGNIQKYLPMKNTSPKTNVSNKNTVELRMFPIQISPRPQPADERPCNNTWLSPGGTRH